MEAIWALPLVALLLWLLAEAAVALTPRKPARNYNDTVKLQYL